jgi:4-hydroxyphenylpyruvate dioxygenase
MIRRSSLDFANAMDQEKLPAPSNPLGIEGVEFIEYATREPLALGALLQQFGFVPVARHRSREVMLYRQGDMNIVVDADPASVRESSRSDAPTIAAVAFRVRDAAYAHRRALEQGAWDMPTRAAAMELNIPGIHGVGDSLIYFVERHKELTIYDVDFVPIPGVDPAPPALAGLHWFGLVQAVQSDRAADWVDFYRALLGFELLKRGQYFGVLPKGTLLESPDGSFYFQLVEPPPNADFVEWNETLLRVGLGAPDVLAAVRALQSRGVVFVDREPMRPSEKGALTQIYLGGFCVELVVSAVAAPALKVAT